MRGDFDEAVHQLAGLIPPGRVLSYGDLAELLETGGPRQVGAAMSSAPDGTPWWRVIRASGLPPQGHSVRALPHYEAEGTPLQHSDRAPSSPGQEPRRDSYRVAMGNARWEPTEGQLALVSVIRASLSEPHDEVKP